MGSQEDSPKFYPKGLWLDSKIKAVNVEILRGNSKKVDTPKPEHPETDFSPEESEVHANHLEAFNSSLRRYLSAFRRRTNTYAKSGVGLQRVLNIFWMVHNFIRPHFTTQKVPAVAIGILEKGLSWEDLLQLRILR